MANMEVSCSQEELDELLVFGYASNIYRDNERAQWIDEGRHMIPLLGDSSILIDRYDGRGALVDPKACEALTAGTPITDPEEIELERLCDLERYRDYQDDEELVVVSELMNGRGRTVKDEDIQERSSRKGAMIEYSYDSPEPEEKESDDSRISARDYVYAAPAGLYLPHDLILPQTMKSHAVIEKTAKFIASHGTQMEIILKTKQGTNPLFNFLTFSDELHPYYRYLVTALKTNAYKPPERASQDERTPNASDSDDEDHYLHPSLVTKPGSITSESKASRILEYKATGPSAYSALVSKIQEMEQPLTEEEEEVVQSIRQLGNQDNNSGADLPFSRSRVPPTGETQVIIEKMAHYVVKNGPAFESLASTKGDTRFHFLNPADPHHWYYIFCKENFEASQVGAVISGGFVPYTKNSISEERDAVAAVGSDAPANHSPEARLAQTPSSVPSKPPPPDHANAMNRMATLPPALIDKIEQLRKRTLEKRLQVPSGPETITPSFQTTPVDIPKIEFPVALLPLQPPNGKSIVVGQDPNGQNNGPGKDDEEIRRKAERRKRAALFLEKMKATPVAEPPPPPVVEPNEVEIIAEIQMRINVPKPKSPSLRTSDPERDDDDDEVEEIARVSPWSRTKRLKREASDSDSEEKEVPVRKHHSKSSKKRSKYSSDSPLNSESEEDRHRSRSSSHKKKSKKKKRKKSERSKDHSTSEKSRRRH